MGQHIKDKNDRNASMTKTNSGSQPGDPLNVSLTLFGGRAQCMDSPLYKMIKQAMQANSQ